MGRRDDSFMNEMLGGSRDYRDLGEVRDHYAELDYQGARNRHIRNDLWGEGLISERGVPQISDLEQVHGLGSRAEIRDYYDRMRGGFDVLRQKAVEEHYRVVGPRERMVGNYSLTPFSGSPQEFVSWQADYYMEGRGSEREWREFKKLVLELKASGVEFDDRWAETDASDDRKRGLAQDPRDHLYFGFARDRFLSPAQQAMLGRIDRLTSRGSRLRDVADPSAWDANAARLMEGDLQSRLALNNQVEARPRPLETGAYLRVGLMSSSTELGTLVKNALNLSMYTPRGGDGIWLPEFHRMIRPVIGIGTDPLLYDVATRTKLSGPIAREYSAAQVLEAAVAETVQVMQARSDARVLSFANNLLRQGKSDAYVSKAIANYLHGSEFQRQFRLEAKKHFRGLVEHFDGADIGNRAYGARDASRLVFGVVGDRLTLNTDMIPNIDPFTLAFSNPEQRAYLEQAMAPDDFTKLQAFGLDKLERLGGQITDFDFTFMAQGLYRRRAAENVKPARFFLDGHLARLGVTARVDEETNVYFIPAGKWAQIPQRLQTLSAMLDLDYHAGEGGTLRNAQKLWTTQAGDSRSGVGLKGFVVFGLGDTGFMNEHAFGRAAIPQSRLSTRDNPNILLLAHDFAGGSHKPTGLSAMMLTPDMQLIDTYEVRINDGDGKQLLDSRTALEAYRGLEAFTQKHANGGRVVIGGDNVQFELDYLKRAEADFGFHLPRSATVYDPNYVANKRGHRTADNLAQQMGIEARLEGTMGRLDKAAQVLRQTKASDPRLLPTPQGGTLARQFKGAMVSYKQTKQISVPTHQLDQYIRSGLLVRAGDMFGSEVSEIAISSVTDGLKSAERAIFNPASKYGAGAYTQISGIGYEDLGFYTRIQVGYEVYRPFTSMDRIMDVLKVPVVVARRNLFERFGSAIQQAATTDFDKALLQAAGMDANNLADDMNILVGEGVIKTGEVALQSGAAWLAHGEFYRNHLRRVSDADLQKAIGNLDGIDPLTGKDLYKNVRGEPLAKVRRMMHDASKQLRAGQTLSIANMDHVVSAYVAMEIVKNRFADSTRGISGALTQVFGVDRDGGSPVAFAVPVNVVAGFSASATPLGTRNVGFMTYYNSGQGTDTLLEMLSDSEQSKAKRQAVGELYASAHFGSLTGRVLFGGIHFDPLVFLSLGEDPAALSRLGRITDALRTGTLQKDVTDRATGQQRRIARDLSMAPLQIDRLRRMGQAMIARHAAGAGAGDARRILTGINSAQAMDILKAQQAFGVGTTVHTLPIIDRHELTGKMSLIEMKRLEILDPSAVLKLSAFVDHVGPLAKLQVEIQQEMGVLTRIHGKMGDEDWARYDALRDKITAYETEKLNLTGSALQKAFGKVYTAGRTAILGAVPGIPEGTLVVGTELHKVLRREARTGVMEAATGLQRANPGMSRADAVLVAMGERPDSLKAGRTYGQVAELKRLRNNQQEDMNALDRSLRGSHSKLNQAAPARPTKAHLRKLARTRALYRSDERFSAELGQLETRFRRLGLLEDGQAMPVDLAEVNKLMHAENLLMMRHSGAQEYMRAALQRSGSPIGFAALSVQKIMSIRQHNRQARLSGGVELSNTYGQRAVFANLGAMSVFLGDFDGDTAAVGALREWATAKAFEAAGKFGYQVSGIGERAVQRMNKLRDSLIGNAEQQLIEFARTYTGFGADVIQTKADAIAHVKQSSDVFGVFREEAMRHIDGQSHRLKGLDGAARDKVLSGLIQEYVTSKQFADGVDKLRNSEKITEPIRKALLMDMKTAQSVATAIAWSATAVIGQTFNTAYDGAMILRVNRRLLGTSGYSDVELNTIDGIYQSMNQIVRDAIKPKHLQEVGDALTSMRANPMDTVRQSAAVRAAESMLVLSTGKDFMHNKAITDYEVRTNYNHETFQKHLTNIQEGLMEFHEVFDKRGDIKDQRKFDAIQKNVQTFGRFLSETQQYRTWLGQYRYAAAHLSTPEFEKKSIELDQKAGHSMSPNHLRMLAIWSSASRGKLGADADGDNSMGRMLNDLISRYSATPDALRREADQLDTTGNLGKSLYEVANRLEGKGSQLPIENPRAVQASREIYREFLSKVQGVGWDAMNPAAVDSAAARQHAINRGRASIGHQFNSNLVAPFLVMSGMLGNDVSASELGEMGAMMAMSMTVPGAMITSMQGIQDPRTFAAHAATMAGTMVGAIGVGHLATRVGTDLASKFARPAMAGKIGGLIGAMAATVAGFGISELANAAAERAGLGAVGFGRIGQGSGDMVGEAQQASADAVRAAGGQDEVEQLIGAPSTQLVNEDGIPLPWGDDQPADNGSYTISDEFGDHVPSYTRSDPQYSEGFDWSGPLQVGSLKNGAVTTLDTTTDDVSWT